MIKPPNRLHGHRTLQQHMRPDNIIPRKTITIPKTQVHMRLRREMEHRIDVVFPQTSQHIRRFQEIAVEELEIGPAFDHARVVERTAVVKFVEADDVVRVGVFDDEVADEPGCAVEFPKEGIFGQFSELVILIGLRKFE